MELGPQLTEREAAFAFQLPVEGLHLVAGASGHSPKEFRCDVFKEAFGEFCQGIGPAVAEAVERF